MVDQYSMILQRLLQTVEEFLGKELDLDMIAKRSGLSKYHLHRVFRSMSGVPIMEYVRRRRLSASLEVLSSSQQRIIDIALQFGFEYEQSYCRAFQRQFGISPGEYRRTRSILEAQPELKLSSFNAIGRDSVLLEPRFVFLPKTMLCGQKYRVMLEENAKKSIVTQIGNQFWSERENRIPYDIREGQYWGLVEYSKDPAWSWYSPSVRLRHLLDPAVLPPEGLRFFNLDGQNLAAFTLIARIHPTCLQWPDVEELYHRIFNEWLPASGITSRSPWHIEHIDLARAREDYGELTLFFPIT